MITHSRTHLRPISWLVAVALLAACTSSTPGSVPAAASPGQALGALPGVEGFAYRTEAGGVPGFLQGAEETLGDDVEIEIGQAAAATRGDDEVSLIVFSFPGADDAQAVDYFARILDDMEDGFQAGSQRGLDGKAYLMTGNGQTVVLAPWGRVGDDLVFLFALGLSGATEDLAGAILNVEG